MANNSTGFTKTRWVHKGLTKQVDNAFIISSKEPDGVFEEQHEGCIDDSISQLVGIDLRESNQPRHLSLKLLHSDLLPHKKQKVCFWIREIQQSRCTLHTPDEQLLTTRAAEPRGGGLHLKLTLKSRRASIWFWIMGIVFSSFSVFIVLITPSTLCGHTQSRSRRGQRGEERWGSKQCRY